MGTEGIEREQFVSAPREDHRFSIRVPQQHRPVVYLRDGDAHGEVWPSECCGGGGHSISREPEARPRSPRVSSIKNFLFAFRSSSRLQ